MDRTPVHRAALWLLLTCAACPSTSHEGLAGDGGSASAASAEGVDAGGILASVSFNLPPGPDCVVDLEGKTFIATGQYDVAGNLGDAGAACDAPYTLNLFVWTELPTTERLQVQSAQVRLTTLTHESIVFDRGQKLPNPFQALLTWKMDATGDTLKGLASVEAIPKTYAAQLGNFVGLQVLAEVELKGVTGKNEAVDVQRFAFPIELCDGCLTACKSSAPDGGSADACHDNAAADGRICIDDGC